MVSDSLFFIAGALIFAIWVAVVGSINIAAFGNKLLPAEVRESTSDAPSTGSSTSQLQKH